MHEQMFPVALSILFGITLIELVLLARWNRAYYRSSVIVFRRFVPTFAVLPVLPSPVVLDATFSSKLAASMLFREVAPGELAFREKLIGFHLLSYTPIMHGHIESRPQERTIVVSGRLNWSTLVFVLMFGVIIEPKQWLSFLPFLAALIGVLCLIYGVQSLRYRRIVDFISKNQEPGV